MLSAPSTSFMLAYRSLVRRPQVALMMAATMALSIGVAATVFSLFDQVFVRALPFPQPERLLRIHTYDPAAPAMHLEVSLPDYEDFRRRLQSFESLSAHVVFPSNLQIGNRTTAVRVGFATPEIFSLLGAEARLGRVYTSAEDILYGDVRKAVLSHALWQQLFNGDRGVLGRSVVLRGEAYEVIGVMPPTFTYPERVDLWAPMMARYSSFADRWWELRVLTMHTVLGRLKPGVPPSRAQEELDVLMAEIRQQYKDDVPNAHAGVRAMRDVEVRALRPYVLAATVAAILVLVIGALNIASLLVAQAVARDREMALHAALGASPRQLFTRVALESVLVGGVGSVGGVAVAHGGMRLLGSIIPVSLPFWLTLAVDARVLLFVTASALLLSLLVALAPMRHHRSMRLSDIITRRGSVGADRGAMRLRRGLLLVQVASGMVVVTVAGLIARSVARIQEAESGMDSARILAVRGSRYIPNLTVPQEAEQYGDAWLRIAARLAQLPGVAAVAVADEIPFELDMVRRNVFRMYTRERSTAERAPMLSMSGAFIMPGYFAAMGIPLREGRDFAATDVMSGAHVIVISDAMARTLFPGRTALGQEVKWGEDPEFPWATVIGVVGPSRWIADEREAGTEFYFSQRQHPTAYPRFLVRTTGDPATLAATVRGSITAVSPEFGVQWVKPLETLRREGIWRRTLAGWVIGLFGALSLLLSTVGVYGVAAYAVSRRAREMSLRLALGSSTAALVGVVVRDLSSAIVPGIVAGIAIALAGGRVLGPLLWNTSPVDPGALVGAAALIIAAALLALIGPAVRVWRIAPMRALQDDG